MKYKNITKAYTIWCNTTYEDKELPYDHKAWHQEEGFYSKVSFAKSMEKSGWKYTNGHWYCPVCVKEFYK